MIMRFRPANIRLINRRLNLPDYCSLCTDTVTPYQSKALIDVRAKGTEKGILATNSQTPRGACFIACLICSGAFGDDEGDVVVLLGGAELLDLFDD